MLIRKFSVFVFLIGVVLGSFCCFFKICARDLLQKESVAKFPVYFYPFSSIPVMKLEIEGMECLLEIDLGASGTISLRKNILEKIKNKKPNGKISFMNIKGNVHEELSFLVPSIYTNNLTLSDVILREESNTFLAESTIWPLTNKITKRKKKALSTLHGSIGRGVFQAATCFFDFPNRALYLSEGLEFYKANHFIDHFLEVSFSEERTGIVIIVETDFGPKRFLVDTGATLSLFKKKSLEGQQCKEAHPERWRVSTHTFIIGGQNYGPCTIAVFNISDHFNEIDGILGIDFFKQHALLLDFQEKKAYLQPPRKYLIQRMKDLLH